jgi:hypothetical protein
MEAAALPEPHGCRGTPLLLEHCAALGRVVGQEGRDVRARLERAVGSDLAQRLVGALTAGGRSRSCTSF